MGFKPCPSVFKHEINDADSNYDTRYCQLGMTWEFFRDLK